MEEEKSKNKNCERETVRGAEGVGGRTGRRRGNDSDMYREIPEPQNNFCYLVASYASI